MRLTTAIRPLLARRGALLLVLLALGLTAHGQVEPLMLPPSPNQPTPPPRDPAAQPANQPSRSKRPKRILGDTTQTRYGPQTTRVFYETDALAGHPRTLAFDTTFRQMWNARTWYHDSTWQQDLGNVGSAARSLLLPVGQPVSGIRWGRRAFDRYAFDLPAIPYYDTRSPYSQLYYIQGSRGEQVLEGRYTRNATKAFNVGVAYQRLSANKQLLNNPGQTKDNYVLHAAPAIWATYQTPDSTWRVFAGYAHMYHEVVEFGGLQAGSVADPLQTIDYTAAQPRLTTAFNREFRNSWHLTQILRLAGPGLQLFYTFERRVQAHRFKDAALAGEDQSVYPAILLDSVQTEDYARFRLNQHTAGLLGGARFGSYRLYASRRDARYVLYQPGSTVPADTSHLGVYEARNIGRLALGGEVQFRVRDRVAVTADGELQSGDNTYWARGTARYRWLTVSQLRNGYSPTITEEAFYGNHARWDTAFANTQRDETRAALALGVGRHRFWVEAAFDRIRNYVYYGLDARPRQETGTLSLGTAQVRWLGQFGVFNADVRAALTYRPGRTAVVYRAPDVLGNVLLYYQGRSFKKGPFVQTGLDIYVQAASRALAWQPATQQFHLQDAVNLPAVPVADVFVAVKLKRVNAFIKVANVLQGVPRGAWYQTPGYPQLRRSFTFGVKWAFFD